MNCCIWCGKELIGRHVNTKKCHRCANATPAVAFELGKKYARSGKIHKSVKSYFTKLFKKR
jgi:hypothetical protein